MSTLLCPYVLWCLSPFRWWDCTLNNTLIDWLIYTDIYRHICIHLNRNVPSMYVCLLIWYIDGFIMYIKCVPLLLLLILLRWTNKKELNWWMVTSNRAMFLPSYCWLFSMSLAMLLLMNGLLSLGAPSAGGDGNTGLCFFFSDTVLIHKTHWHKWTTAQT